MRLTTRAAAAGNRTDVSLALEVAEGGHAGLDHERDAPAVAAVAAVRATAWHVRLPTECAGAVASRATDHEDPNSISEAGHGWLLSARR